MDLEEKVTELLIKGENLLSQAAEPTVELVLMTTRLTAGAESLQNLLSFIILFIIGYKCSKLLYPIAIKDKIEGNDELIGTGCTIVLIAIILPIVLSVINLLDLWNYIGIFYPEAYLMHELILKLN
jgi:hypothetical protein